MGWILGCLPPALAVIAISRLAPSRDRLAIVAVTIGLAFGATSVTWGGWFLVGVRPRAVLLGLDAAAWLLIAIAAFVFRRKNRETLAYSLPRPSSSRAMTIATTALLLMAASVAVTSFVAWSAVFPHGEWDAWAQWNLRARFFFRGFESGAWRNAFAPVLAWSHADYPPLVPLSVARLWLYVGRDTTAAPIAFAAAIAVATVASAGFGAARTRGAARGCLAALAIVASPSFVRYAPAQYADIPLGFFMLSAFILWGYADAPRGRLWLALAGLSAALAAWTKNEGIPFLVLFVLIVAVERVRKHGAAGWREAAVFAVGAAPVVLLLLFFKEALAPPSYFVAEQSLQQAIEKLFDFDRVRLVFGSVSREAWLSGATHVGVLPFLVSFAVVRGVDPNAPIPAKIAAPAMVAMLAIYTVAYIVTPKDLAWQLKTSLDRLIVQLVPTLAWSIATIAK